MGTEVPDSAVPQGKVWLYRSVLRKVLPVRSEHLWRAGVS